MQRREIPYMVGIAQIAVINGQLDASDPGLCQQYRLPVRQQFADHLLPVQICPAAPVMVQDQHRIVFRLQHQPDRRGAADDVPYRRSLQIVSRKRGVIIRVLLHQESFVFLKQGRTFGGGETPAVEMRNEKVRGDDVPEPFFGHAAAPVDLLAEPLAETLLVEPDELPDQFILHGHAEPDAAGRGPHFRRERILPYFPVDLVQREHIDEFPVVPVVRQGQAEDGRPVGKRRDGCDIDFFFKRREQAFHPLRRHFGVGVQQNDVVPIFAEPERPVHGLHEPDIFRIVQQFDPRVKLRMRPQERHDLFVRAAIVDHQDGNVRRSVGQKRRHQAFQVIQSVVDRDDDRGFAGEGGCGRDWLRRADESVFLLVEHPAVAAFRAEERSDLLQGEPQSVLPDAFDRFRDHDDHFAQDQQGKQKNPQKPSRRQEVVHAPGNDADFHGNPAAGIDKAVFAPAAQCIANHARRPCDRAADEKRYGLLYGKELIMTLLQLPASDSHVLKPALRSLQLFLQLDEPLLHFRDRQFDDRMVFPRHFPGMRQIDLIEDVAGKPLPLFQHVLNRKPAKLRDHFDVSRSQLRKLVLRDCIMREVPDEEVVFVFDSPFEHLLNAAQGRAVRQSGEIRADGDEKLIQERGLKSNRGALRDHAVHIRQRDLGEAFDP